MRLHKSALLTYIINPLSLNKPVASFSAPFPLFEQAQQYFVERKIVQQLAGTKTMILFDEFSTINPSALFKSK